LAPFDTTLIAALVLLPMLVFGMAVFAPARPPVRVAFFYKPPADGTPVQFLADYFKLIILTHGDESYLAELRRAGYGGPVLQYIAANEAEGPGPYADANAPCDAHYPTYQRTVVDRDGVFCREVHPHESWFLHDGLGRRLQSRYQSGNGVWRSTYLMNPASAGWRAFLIRRLRDYRHLDFDGFFLDNVDLTRAGMSGVAEYADDAQLQAAQVTYLADLRRAFPHLPIWANLTHDTNAAGGWSRYLPFLDGVMIEDFSQGWRTDQLTPQQHEMQLSNARAAIAHGKGVLAVEQGGPGDVARLALGLADLKLLGVAPPRSSPANPRQPSGLYFRYGDAFHQDYRTVDWYAAYDSQ
jgi:hypothetical protein